jgi:starch-binding outer membrane protein, SusD/RagB family
MKINRKILILLSFTLFVGMQGCNDILEEHPKTSFTMAYYETKQGFKDGINAGYAYLRFQYGTNPALGLNVTGTDEYTFGPEPNYNSSGDNLPHKLLGTYDVTPSAGYLLVTFNRTFPVINMLNALLDIAAEVPDFSESERNAALAEVHYLRAHYYYLLVGQFGAVPIDFGSGDYKFNTIAFKGFNRLDPDLLKKNYQGMIDDLNEALKYLPDARPAKEYRISKAVALHLLSKIYLFRGYSSVAEANDFTNAYETAMELINFKEKYGVSLNQNFADAYAESNEYNTEIIFAAERIPNDNLNNEYTNPAGIGDRENMAANCFTSNYSQARLNLPSGGNPIGGRPYEYNRPLRKLAPTPWLLNVAFADKVNDSRYHGSFRSLYKVATQEPAGSAAYNTFVSGIQAMSPPRAIGDTAFFLADSEEQAAALQGKYYRVYKPSEFYTNQLYPPGSANQILVYPGLTKFNDSKRANFNNASGRPQLIFKFSETYLNAAEAAMKIGKTTEAVDLINVIRHRAAYRPSRPGMNTAANDAANAAAVTEMTISAGDLNLDFILDERSRELCGESLRWVDLAVRGDEVFVNRVKLNPDAQNVQPHHRLRPIPQQQLDAISDSNKEQYQNQGY